MANMPIGAGIPWRRILSIFIHLCGIGILILALYASGTNAAIVLQ